MKVVLNVKSDSVQKFMDNNKLYPTDYSDCNPRNFKSSYNHMTDEILFKIDCGIKVGENVRIELYDRAEQSRRKLINTYIYKAEYYDDIAIKMELVSFKVEAIEDDGNPCSFQ